MKSICFGSRRGQAIVEYIIVVVLIAIAALAIFGLFGDRIRQLVGGTVSELGGQDMQGFDQAQGGAGQSLQKLKSLGQN